MKTVTRKNSRMFLPGALALALCAALPAWAQDAAPAAPAASTADEADDNAEETVLRFDNAITPEARAAMDKMKATMNGLQRFTLTAEISRDETLSYGYKLQHNEFVDMPQFYQPPISPTSGHAATGCRQTAFPDPKKVQLRSAESCEAREQRAAGAIAARGWLAAAAAFSLGLRIEAAIWPRK